MSGQYWKQVTINLDTFRSRVLFKQQLVFKIMSLDIYLVTTDKIGLKFDNESNEAAED